MYRLLFPLLLCVNAANSAPQSKADSDVTFVKIQPVLEDTAPEVTNKRRESRIENLPLTIPGNTDGTDDKPPNGTPSAGTVSNEKPNDDTVSDDTLNGKPTDDTVSDGTFNGKRTDDTVSDETLNGKPTDDTVSDSTTNDKSSYGTSDETLPDLSVQNTEVSEQKTDITESENKSDILPQQTQSRQGRNYHSSDETTESFEIATEKYEEVTEIEPKKPPPFSPKLSYFPKNYDRFSTNLIEKPGKRQFRSRCRCEKIWNCPKLQISVPRCPDEYFLCCF